MINFITQNKEVLTLCVALIGILCAMCFGGVLNWRHKICIDYESRRDVAINILRDRFVQQTSLHYQDIAERSAEGQIDIKELYKQKQQQDMIRDLASTLEDSNRIARYFGWLDNASHTALIALWASIVLAILKIIAVFYGSTGWFSAAIGWLLTITIVVFVIAMSFVCYLDGCFFRMVNAVIKPEGE